ncbi:hypothetical protein PanWU01x14_220960 [Parasponia andersonii]|uniref:Uncharacterized protein n=1 Tax=Parasponia andersonii TaxID=3476 RepID=A0A2P5BPY2_PARAD|nr:hypothetical protein PanWU01x14_220960 [Parasponia andersonii]
MDERRRKRKRGGFSEGGKGRDIVRQGIWRGRVRGPEREGGREGERKTEEGESVREVAREGDKKRGREKVYGYP